MKYWELMAKSAVILGIVYVILSSIALVSLTGYTPWDGAETLYNFLAPALGAFYLIGSAICGVSILVFIFTILYPMYLSLVLVFYILMRKPLARINPILADAVVFTIPFFMFALPFSPIVFVVAFVVDYVWDNVLLRRRH